MRNVAVILAGGTGKRSGLDIPKQFFVVADKMVIEHTVLAFERNSNIDEIAIVSHKDYVDDIHSIISKNGWTKVTKVIVGGNERYLSTLSAVKAFEGQDVNLLIHDAARLLVSQRIIDDVTAALNTHQAVTVAIPSSDTLYRTDKDKDNVFVNSILERSYIMRAQTPQAFHVSLLSHAFKLALNDSDFNFTDDCSVVLKYLPYTKIFIVSGDDRNIKLTYKEDIPIIDSLMK